MLQHNFDGLIIQQFMWDIIDSNSYLIIEGDSGLLIDVIDSSELFNALKHVKDLTVILTHCHFDHICGLNKLRENTNCIVYATTQCSKNIGNKIKNMSSTGNAFMTFYMRERTEDSAAQLVSNLTIDPFTCKPADKVFDGETMLEWEGHEIILSQFFGHSNDSLVAILDEKYLFSGDTLLSIPTVTRFPSGSTPRFWKEDIPRLKQMIVEEVFPGHGKTGKIEEMIAENIVPERYRLRKKDEDISICSTS